MMEKKTINAIIRDAMKSAGITQQAMAYAIGKKKATDVSTRLVSENMTINRALEMLNVCGYEIVVQPVKKGNRPDGQIVVAFGEEKKTNRGKKEGGGER